MNQAYEKDNIVEYKGKYYIAIEDKNIIEPNNIYARLLYVLINYLFRFFLLNLNKFFALFYFFKAVLLFFN